MSKASEAASLMAKKRWQGTTREQRVAVAKLGGRPRKRGQRCFCGASTMASAVSHYFDCCRKAGVMELHLDRRRDEPSPVSCEIKP